jgi:hypothetical protein
MRTTAQHETVWFKSSYSGAYNANCLEATFTETSILVRDSKNRQGPRVQFGPAAWRNFRDQASAE